MSAARNRTVWTAVGAVTVLNIGVAVYTSRTMAHDGHAASKNTAGTAPAAAASPAPPRSSSAHPAQSSDEQGAPRALPSLLADRPMDGIDMASVDRFWDIWKLVDVRYRSDNGEQRFVYANDVAWKTMQAKGTHYPDGAMFGKLAFHTANDPAFPSSFEPRGFSRLQIMKKDTKAYPDSDGWGYAVITSAEEKDAGLPAEDLQIAAACHACHRLVPERDFVFSRGPFTDPGEVSVQGLLKGRFVSRTVRELTATQQRLVEVLAHSSPSDSIRYLAMPLFTGSVNEVAPVLAKYANEDHSVYLLSDTENGNFALADGTTPLPEAGAECAPGTHVAWTASPSGNRGLAPEGVKSARLCGDRLVFSLYRKLSDVVAPPSDPWQRRVDVPVSARPPTPPK